MLMASIVALASHRDQALTTYFDCRVSKIAEKRPTLLDFTHLFLIGYLYLLIVR